MGEVEKVGVNAVFLLELQSKDEWIRRVPKCLPPKQTKGEQWIWVDKNGNVFHIGEDFEIAENENTYPCRIYRLQTISEWKESSINQGGSNE